MKTTLLYVYKAQLDNRFTYAFTMELAKRLHLKVITFTAVEYLNYFETVKVDRNEFISNEKRKIFTHLLALHGYYQVFYNQWSPAGNPVSKNIIENGSFDNCLMAALKEESVACVIIDSQLCQCVYNLEKLYDSFSELKDIPFMVLPKKISYNPNERLKENSAENEIDVFLDSVIGDSDLFKLCSQKEYTNL
jgi:hypothetical protein